MTRPVIGLDLSLTSTGIAVDGWVRTIKPKATGMSRLQFLRRSVMDEVAELSDPLVVIEGYSFGSRASQAHALGELGGVIRLALWEAGVTYVDVPPSSVKKFACNHGNASKDQVLVAAVKAGAPVDGNDGADAWWLRQMGLYLMGRANVPVTEYRAAAVAACDWGAVGNERPAEVAS